MRNSLKSAHPDVGDSLEGLSSCLRWACGSGSHGTQGPFGDISSSLSCIEHCGSRLPAHLRAMSSLVGEEGKPERQRWPLPKILCSRPVPRPVAHVSVFLT